MKITHYINCKNDILMHNITQILQSVESSLVKKNGLRIPLVAEVSQKEIMEYNLFKRINQVNQFYSEKNKCVNFRFCGHVNETVNLKLPKTEKFAIQPTFNNFDLSNNGNWVTYIMAPLANADGTKGDTNIKISDNGNIKTLNLEYGVPALIIDPEQIGNRMRNGLLFYLGHNLKTNDLLQLRTNVIDARYPDGVYRVIKVNGKKVYLQIVSNKMVDSLTISNDGNTNISSGALDEPMAVLTGGIELGVTETYYQSLLARPSGEVNWLAIYNPHIFVKKIINQVPSDYYMKKMYSVGLIKGGSDSQNGDMFNCAFAQNSYGQQSFIYTPSAKLSFEGYQTNLKMPITDVYLSFVKEISNQNELQTYQVLASFQNFVTSTFDDGELQVVQRFNSHISYTNNSNFLYHSLVEYNTETLVEVEINKVCHTFFANKGVVPNPIRFSYDPFYHMPIRKLSNSIEQKDINDGIPNYAVYSQKYQIYRWRKLLNVGFFEENNNGVDFPYLNDAFYVYGNVLLNIRNHKSPKVPSLLSGGYLISSNTDTLVIVEGELNITGNDALDDSLLDENKNDKPYEEYGEKIC